MSRNKSLVLLAGAALGMASSATLAQSTPDAYRAELLSDASSRSSLLAAGANAVHENGGFGFTDSSGNNSMYLSFYGTYRHFFNFSDDNADSDDDFTHGGQLALVEAAVFGTVGAPNMRYFMQIAASGLEGSDDSDDDFGDTAIGSASGVSLIDYYFSYEFEGGVNVTAGQGKPLQSFEQNAHENQQQRLNRSLPAELFGSGRQQFIGVGSNTETMEWQVFFSDGAQTAGTDFFNPGEADFAIGGAANFHLIGGRDAFYPTGEYGRHFGLAQSAFQGSPEALRIGVNGQYQTHGDTGKGTSEFDLWVANAGIEYRNNGLSARGYVYVANVEPEGGDDSTNWGLSATVGYFVDPQVEIYGGWDSIFWDNEIAGTDDNNNFIVVGINVFPFQNSSAVRFTAEGIYSIDNSGDFLANAGMFGFSGDSLSTSAFNILGSGDEGEFGIGIGASIRN